MPATMSGHGSGTVGLRAIQVLEEPDAEGHEEGQRDDRPEPALPGSPGTAHAAFRWGVDDKPCT